MSEAETKIINSIRAALKPNGKVDLIDLLKREGYVVNSPKGNTIDLNLTPWFKEIFLEIMQNPTMRECNIMSPIGAGKTTLFLAIIYTCILLRAKQILLVGQNEQMTIDSLDLLIKPSLFKNKKIASMWPMRKDNRRESIHFPHMSIFTGYASAINTVQQRSIDYVLNDEVWLYSPEILHHCRGRLHDRSGSRMINVSQGGDMGSAWETNYNKGLIKKYAWCCPNCSTYNIYKFEDLKFDYDKTADNVPIYKSVKAHLECPNCQHQIADTIENRRRLSENAKYVVEDESQNYMPNYYSYNFNQLCVYEVPWENIAREFLVADNSPTRPMALKMFFTKKMGQHWDNTYFQEDYDIGLMEDEYIMDQFKDDLSWKFRFLVADVQQSQMWINIRDFDEYGNSRLVAFKYCSHLNDIETIRKEYQVKSACVAVDMAHRPEEVKLACCTYGWKGYNGREDRTYTWTNKGKRVIKYYSEPKTYEVKTPSGKKTCQCFHYAGTTVKDILTLSLMQSGKWRIPNGGENYDLYMHQTFGSEMREVNNATGKVTYRKVKDDNHSFDNETAMIVLATIFGAFVSEEISEVETV